MTEQRKISLPPQGDGNAKGAVEGGSLFERVSGTFELGGFKPAPVPKTLDPLPARFIRAAKPEPKQRTETATDKPVVGQVAVSTPASGPVPSSETVSFSGDRYPIDRDRLREQGFIVPEGAVTALLEEFRIVKRQLLQTVRDSRRNGQTSHAERVLICSPLPNEGKTFCATNLALAIAAERDCEVLLVDADFAKPSVLSTLGLPGEGVGLMDALVDPSIRVEDCVIGTDVPGLWVLPAGNQSNSDSEFLASDRTAEVFDRLTQGAENRIVIFDSPPALAASPAAELAKYVGQALLVVRADSSGQSSLADALSLLSACSNIKLLLNDARFSPSGRRFGTYYGYEG